MENIGTLPGERLADLSADLFLKLKAGALTVDELALFVQRKNPFAFERNEHGHIIITITGLDLTGAEEIERLEAAGYCLNGYAKSCFTSAEADGYDKNHRLVAGRHYKIALLLGKEIQKDSDRSVENLRALGTKFGYGKPLGGFIPRIREIVSDKQMEEMGIFYISSLHEPIKDRNDDPRVFEISREGDGNGVTAYCYHYENKVGEDGAFAFPASVS